MWDLVGNPEDRFSHNEAHINQGGYFVKLTIFSVIIYLEKLSIQFAMLKTLSIFDTNRCQGKFYDIDWV